MQSLLVKLHTEIESRKRPHWDIVATAKSASLGTALALIAFLLGIRAAEARVDGGTLMEHLDVIPEHCRDYDFSRFRVFRDLNVSWDANWKTALEAFIEFYHADDVHPELLPLTATRTPFEAHGIRQFADHLGDAAPGHALLGGGGLGFGRGLGGHVWSLVRGLRRRR